MLDEYRQFLETKRFCDLRSGFDVPLDRIHDRLFDFQRALVRWALIRGRSAIFADTGLGKTAMQVVWADHVCRRTNGRTLILAPLAVSHQTVAEAARFDVAVRYRRADDGLSGIQITNYEMLDRFNIADFDALVLDESSILKSHDGKTRSAIIEAAQRVPYRLSCTATPSPNDFMELGNQAEFVGVMSRLEMLSMFFTHDGGDTSHWRLKGHGEARFWEWLSTWAAVIRNPADLGFDGSRYNLPPLRIHEHIVEAGAATYDLFERPAVTLNEQREAKRISLAKRVEGCAQLVTESPGPWLIWCHLNAESHALADAIQDGKAVAGSDSIESKEQAMDAFSDGALRALISKPSICGFGMNWQHCHQIAFAGLDHSFEQFYQAIRRCWRFGQTEPVDVHIFLSRAEIAILDNIRRKEAQHDAMSASMVEHMRGLMQSRILGAQMETTEYTRDVRSGENWTLHNADCVDVVSELPENSIHYSIFSPPFSSLYVYSNSDRDMGNSRSDAAFMDHFRFLVAALYRATMPGRLLSFHCSNIPAMKSRDGFIGINDFRGQLIELFRAGGWIFHSEVCIWKDPVTQMQRTKALGLLHKQIKKDSSMSRQGLADYLVTMRKPGDNPEPITHTNESFPVHVWQRYASPVWMDINQSRTLQYREARENEDERHICPLQLDVIERAIELWTNPGDLVLSPFAGIGSEGYSAIKMGRRFIGIELKRSYWSVAIQNLEGAESSTQSLFIDNENAA